MYVLGYIRPVLNKAEQKTPSLLGAECKGIVRYRFHADERGQTEGLYP